MYNKKRGQSEIITTVLIILLVLAAIVIVWQVVKTTVQSGTGQVEAQANCIGMNLEITDVTSSYAVGPPATANITIVKVKRGADSITKLEALKIIVEDDAGARPSGCVATDFLTGLPNALEEKPFTLTCMGLTPGDTYTVKVAPKIDGQQCDVGAEEDETTPTA